MKQVERTEKGRREGARGRERWKESIGVEEKKEGQRGLEREKRETLRRKGRHSQGWICPFFSALAWSQRKVGALKSVAFSDTQFRLVKGEKRNKVCQCLWGLSLPAASSLDG